MADKSIEDSLAVIAFEDDQNNSQSAKIMVSANGETSYRVKERLLVC